jgi:cell division initiation protein
MKITSMDISNKEFRKVIRGYDCDEVDEFLDKIAEDYEAMYKENSSLKEKLASYNDKLEHYAKMETTIQNTLLLAQNAAEQAKQSAQKEAEIALKNANESAQKIIDKAHNDVLQIHDEYEAIKQEFLKFRSKFRSFMTSQLEMFNSMEKDFLKTYSIGKETNEGIRAKENELQLEDIGDENIERPVGSEFKVNNLEEDFLNDNTTLNEIKNFFVKE